MTLREQLASIEAEIKVLEEKRSTLSEQEYQLDLKRNEIINALIIEEIPLQGTSWELTIGSMGKPYLRYLGNRNDEVMGPISDLCSTSWHDSFALSEGVKLQFDDGSVALVFDDSRAISIFAQRQSLVIVAPTIVDKIRQLTRDLSALETLSHQFNLKG